MMDPEETYKRVKEYSNFINKVLRPELKLAQDSKKKVKTEILEYKELSQMLQTQEKDESGQYETTVDLGFKTVYCQAVAKDVSKKIFVHIGMGFHVEHTIPEAIEAVSKRIKFLEDDVLAERERKVKEVGDHLESARQVFNQLEREMQRAS